MIKVGARSPEFTFINDGGDRIVLSNPGQIVLLFFYPKSYSPICTKEMCTLRDDFSPFRAQGVQVFGISQDDAKTQLQFRDENKLPFPILSDVGGKISKAFGVTSLVGGMTQRVTVAISSKGIVAMVFKSTLFADAHVKNAIEIVEKLASGEVESDSVPSGSGRPNNKR